MEHALTTPLTLTEPAPRRSLAVKVRLWLSLWSERRALAQLDDRMLADIGVTREAIEIEAIRAPWDIPAPRELDL